MTVRTATLTLLLVSVFIASSRARAQDLETFVSSDGAFRFEHSRQLVRSTFKPQGDSGIWQPEDCLSQADLCGSAAFSATTLACYAYPKARFEAKPMFAGSAFFVARIKDEITKKDCLKGSSQWLVSSTRKLRVNKISFARFEIGDAWAGGAQTGYVYRTFHRGACYELGITGAARHDGLDPDTTQDFTQEDQEEVFRALDEPLRSFQFSR